MRTLFLLFASIVVLFFAVNCTSTVETETKGRVTDGISESEPVIMEISDDDKNPSPARKMTPEELEAHLKRRAEIEREIPEEEAAPQKPVNNEEVSKLLGEMTTGKKEDGSVLLTEAIKLVESGKLIEALDKIKSSRRVWPTNPALKEKAAEFFDMGKGLYDKEQFQEAEPWLALARAAHADYEEKTKDMIFRCIMENSGNK